MDKTALALIVLLMLIAFFLVPSAAGMPVVDPDGRIEVRRTPVPTSSTPTSTPFPTAAPWDHDVVNRSLRYLYIVRRTEQVEGWLYDPAIVMGIIAQESLGFVNPNKVLGWPLDRVGSRGLMQVAPFKWRVDDPDKLLNPYVNIWWGLNTLDYDYKLANGDMRKALALYNCWTGESYGCGYNYADKILFFWTPLFREAFVDGRWRNKLYWNREDEQLIKNWLESFGYKEK